MKIEFSTIAGIVAGTAIYKKEGFFATGKTTSEVISKLIHLALS